MSGIDVLDIRLQKR